MPELRAIKSTDWSLVVTIHGMLDRLLSNLAIEPEPFALCMLVDGWRILLPAPPVPVLHFMLRGKGMVINPDGKGTAVAPLTAVIIPAGMAHILESDGTIEHELKIDRPPADPGICKIVAGTADEYDMVVACGMINARFGDAIGLFDHLHDVLAVDMSSISNAALLFDQLFEEQKRDSTGSDVIIASLMMQLIVHMFRLLESKKEDQLPWLVALQDPRLALAFDSIFEDPGRDHSVESLATIAGMSRSAFAEHFTVAFSSSPISFVNHVRMERAGHLLQEGIISIDQIANQVGFSSRSHFSQLFKKHTGQSPADYRH